MENEYNLLYMKMNFQGQIMERNTFIKGSVANFLIKHKDTGGVIVLNSWPITKEEYEAFVKDPK